MTIPAKPTGRRCIISRSNGADFLPATADSVARYLADHASILAVNTLRQRLAGIAQWHINQGFADPTKVPLVRKVLRGIQATHPAEEKQAKPLQLQLRELEQVDLWLAQQLNSARGEYTSLRYVRDQAILLMGFHSGNADTYSLTVAITICEAGLSITLMSKVTRFSKALLAKSSAAIFSSPT